MQKLPKIIALIMTLLLLCEIFDYLYCTIISSIQDGFSPSYNIFFKYGTIDAVLIFFVNIRITAPLVYLYLLIVTADSLYGFSQTITLNLNHWLHYRYEQPFLSICNTILELIVAIMGLAVWLWLRFGKHKSQLKYS